MESLIAIAFAFSFVRGAAAETPEPIAELDAVASQGVADWEVPGLAVAVVQNGEVIFAKGYGVLELGKEDAADESTLFAIGSTTKAMTAAAVGILVDEGKLGWDDPVTKHLPWFQLRDPVVTREVTVRDLLTHRAGLPNADFLWYGRENAPRDILFRMRYLPQETSLRSHFTYQNVMYAAAGAVVSEASGMPWAEFVRARILEPLGMARTVTTLSGLSGKGNVASPHYRINGQVEVIENASVDPVAAAGSIWSSVSDMAKWMRFLLEGETPEGTRLLKGETLEELFRPQTLVDREEFYPTQRLTRPKWTTYGLGWFQHDYEGRAVDFHTGSIDGMVAIHGLIRSERLGVYVLANLDHAELRHALLYTAFDLFASGRRGDVPRRDWSADLRELYRSLEKEAEERRAELEAKRVPGTRPSLPQEGYVGAYFDPLAGEAAISKSEDRLRLSLGPTLTGSLEHWHHDVFRVSWDRKWQGTAFVSFRLGVEGEVQSLFIDGLEFRHQSQAR
jgi:CubicO group peptidase (beta-lactamase class C family)